MFSFQQFYKVDKCVNWLWQKNNFGGACKPYEVQHHIFFQLPFRKILIQNFVFMLHKIKLEFFVEFFFSSQQIFLYEVDQYYFVSNFVKSMKLVKWLCQKLFLLNARRYFTSIEMWRCQVWHLPKIHYFLRLPKVFHMSHIELYMLPICQYKPKKYWINHIVPYAKIDLKNFKNGILYAKIVFKKTSKCFSKKKEKTELVS
jgi:hypothetical protein